MGLSKIDNDGIIICNVEDIDEKNLKKYKGPGVWALYGKKDSGNGVQDWACLQVAKTTHILAEIQKDIEYLSAGEKCCGGKRYINQFADDCFSYNEDSPCRKQLYSYINEHYSNLEFVCVSLENDKERRTKQEYDYAWLTRAKFWRNGRPFKNPREDYYEKAFAAKQISKEIKNRVRLIMKALKDNDDPAE